MAEGEPMDTIPFWGMILAICGGIITIVDAINLKYNQGTGVFVRGTDL